MIKARVALPTETADAQEWCLTSYPSIINYLLKRCAADDNIAIVNTDIHMFKKTRLAAIDYAQRLWTEALKCRLV